MDLRYAFRRLASSPGFTAVACLTLALGISATTAIYSVVDALLLRPLPYRDGGQLWQLMRVRPGGGLSFGVAYDKLIAWREQTDLFARVEPYTPTTGTLAGVGEPTMLLGAAIGGGVMEMLGATAQIGRTILPSDQHATGSHVLVLADKVWRTRFGADPGIVGRSVRLDDKTYEVIGVMHPGVEFPRNRDFWIPLEFVASQNDRPALYYAIVRVRDGLTMEQAQQRADDVAAAHLRAMSPDAGWGVRLRPLSGMNSRERYALYVLFGAVALVLLIACANLANLLLVEGASRNREIAVRAALGASRRRLVRQLLTETLIIAAAGGAIGVMLAWYAVDVLAVYTPRDLTFLSANEIRLDWRVLAFATAVTLITAAGFGLLPALRTSRTDLHDALKAGVRSATAAPAQERLRRGFVVAQLALSLVLLVGAGLLTRTFVHITHVDPGFDAERLVTANLMLPSWKYTTPAARHQYYERVLGELRTLPGVTAATVAGGAPPSGGGVSFDLEFEIEGRGVVLHDPKLMLPHANVRPDFFSALGIPLLAGRTTTFEDAALKPQPIVISRTMAARLWQGRSPLGERIRFAPDWPWQVVVGVVGDVYQFEHENPSEQFAAYYPLGKSAAFVGQATLIVRTAVDPASMIAAIKQRIWSVDPDQPLYKVATVRDQYSEFFDAPRFYALLMAVFASIGLVIAAVGLYGVLAYAMAQRTREFGIRMALGAEARDVVRMVLRTGCVLIGAGLALGVVGSYVMTRYLESLLVEIPRTDPITYVAVIVTLGAIGLAAAWIPARRATRVDPIVALRTE